jgi:alpha-amylase
MIRFFAALWLISLASCTPATQVENDQPKPPTYWPQGITYEIFIQSWADSDGDGIGDFKGATSTLDYLEDLGIEALWLMPIHPSPSYHKYDVTDYYEIHPDYGTMDDFKSFVSEAHRRGIKVVIDLVINHSSSKHPWFLDAATGKGSTYRDYYVWANRDSVANEIAKKEVSLDSDNIRQWHSNGSDDEHYYGFFYGGMPDLNFDNPKLREEIYAIGKYWLADVGVDGFRLDAAKHIYPDDREADSHAFWKEFRAEMEKVKPDVYLVGEIWGKKETLAPYFEGLQAVFNFDLWFALNDVLKSGKNAAKLPQMHKDGRDMFRTFRPDFIDPTFLSNHDQDRILNFVGGDTAKNKLALAVLMTLPGSPYLYYGEEIGMLGAKPDPNIREPFLWDSKDRDTLRTTWILPKFSTDEAVIPLSLQLNDLNSMYHFYRYWIHLRRWQPVLALGEMEVLDTGLDEIMAFKRSYEGKVFLVYHNFSDKEIKIGAPAGFESIASHKAKIQAMELVLGPLSSVVLGRDE